MQVGTHPDVVGSVVTLERPISPETMSEHGSSSSLTQGQQNDGTAQPQQTGASPQPPPFNPLPSSHHTQVGSSLGHSVVPDLMKVYESLTHSSTPQLPGPQHTMPAPPNVPPQQFSQQTVTQQQRPQQFQSSQYTQHTHQYVTSQPAQTQQPQYQQAQLQPQFVQPLAYYTRSQDASSAYGHQQPISENSFDPGTQDSSPPSSDDNVKSSRRSRKRSLGGGSGSDSGDGQPKGRKKGSQSDGRWSKRFTWPDELHRDFVSAIFDVGLKHSSPSALLEFMPNHDQITSERVKSHLQKYRIHRQKSKKEFMASYDASLGKFQMGGLDSNVKSLSSGEVAAHLSYSTIMDIDENPIPEQDASKECYQDSSAAASQQGGALYLPQLTDTEKQSALGASMGYLMGLFFSLRQQLMQQRSESGYVPQGQGSVSAPVVTDSGASTTTVSAVQPSFMAAGNFNIGNQQAHTQQVPRTDVSVTWSTQAGQAVDPQQPQHQQAYGTHPDGSQESNATQQLISPSTMSNVEENNFMKREMQNQMAFQNKMRALKQQELNKYKTVSSDGHQQFQETKVSEMKDGQMPECAKGEGEDSKDGKAGAASQDAGQTAGATSSTTKNSRGMSLGAPDDFWNSGDVDEHLFEFLMNT